MKNTPDEWVKVPNNQIYTFNNLIDNVKNNNIPAIIEISQNPDNNILFGMADAEKNTPLHFARSKDAVDILVKMGSHINNKNNNGKSPLDIAIENKNLECIEALIDNNCNICNIVKYPYSKQSGNISEIVLEVTDFKDLLPQVKEYIVNNAFKLVKRGEFLEIGEYLNQAKAYNPEYLNNEGNSLLHIAKSPDVIGFLITQMPALINHQNKNGETPLHILMKKEHKDMESILMLVKSGANLKIKDNNGKTPLDYANQEIKEAIENLPKTYVFKDHNNKKNDDREKAKTQVLNEDFTRSSKALNEAKELMAGIKAQDDFSKVMMELKSHKKFQQDGEIEYDGRTSNSPSSSSTSSLESSLDKSLKEQIKYEGEITGKTTGENVKKPPLHTKTQITKETGLKPKWNSSGKKNIRL